tara:strand:+ start:322 stop:735 length:414 start_codon:yes stop_codon:yes gene_type:complete
MTNTLANPNTLYTEGYWPIESYGFCITDSCPLDLSLLADGYCVKCWDYGRKSLREKTHDKLTNIEWKLSISPNNSKHQEALEETLDIWRDINTNIKCKFCEAVGTDRVTWILYNIVGIKSYVCKHCADKYMDALEIL